MVGLKHIHDGYWASRPEYFGNIFFLEPASYFNLIDMLAWWSDCPSREISAYTPFPHAYSPRSLLWSPGDQGLALRTFSYGNTGEGLQEVRNFEEIFSTGMRDLHAEAVEFGRFAPTNTLLF